MTPSDHEARGTARGAVPDAPRPRRRGAPVRAARLDAAEHAPASRDDQLEAARAVALRMLTGAPRTTRQVRDGLARRGYDDDVVTELVDRLVEVGLLDDAELAGMIVRSRVAERGLSRRAVAAELRRKGVADEDAAAALAEVDDEAEADALRRLVRKRLARTAGLDRQVRVRRVMGALARKGYAPGAALAAISAELGAERDELGGVGLPDDLDDPFG